MEEKQKEFIADLNKLLSEARAAEGAHDRASVKEQREYERSVTGLKTAFIQKYLPLISK